MKKIIFAILCVLCFSMATAQTLSFGTLSIPVGGSGTLSINLNNSGKSISSLQADLTLPEGITQNGSITLSGRAHSSHSVYMNSVDGAYRIVVHSSQSATFSGTSGAVLSVPVKASEGIAPGQYSVSLSNISIVTPAGDETETPTVSGTVTIQEIPATSVTLNKTTLSLLIGSTETLTATVKPDNTTNKTVTWTSSKTSVATVDSTGKITAVGVGTATITATCGSKSATCSVTVNPIVATSVTLNKTTLSLLIGGTETLTATVAPSNTTDKTVTWSSSKTSVATVDTNGKITAVGVGTATITATCGSVSASCEVTVDPIVATSVTLSNSELTLLLGASDTLTATVAPDNTTDKSIVWATSNAEVATVENGVVTAVGVGTATITATCGSVSASCEVTVDPIVATSVTLSNSELTLLLGANETLTATVTPDNTTDKSIVWSTSNAEVATVENGVVTAVGIGTATITATCGSVSATCEVTVNPIEYYFTMSNGELRKGETNVVSIGLENVGNVVVVQFDAEIPEGVTLGLDSYGDVNVSIAGRCDNTHVLSSSMVNGHLRVLLYSSKNHPFSGNEGALINIPVNVNEDVETGEILTFKVVNGLITLDGSLVEVASPVCKAEYEVTAYTPGDINNDGKITGADIAFCVEIIMEHNPLNAIVAAADINGDGKVTGADIAAIIKLILNDSQNAPAIYAPSRSAMNGVNCFNISHFAPSSVELSLNNVDNCVAMQFDVLVPEDVVLNNVACGGNNSSLLFAYRNLGNGVYRVVAYSPNNRIADKNAKVAVLNFSGKSIEEVEICNILLTTKTAETIEETAYATINFGNGMSDLYSIESSDMKVWAENGSIVVATDKEDIVVVNDMSGRSRTFMIGAGRNYIPVVSGIYLVNNSKLIVK